MEVIKQKEKIVEIKVHGVGEKSFKPDHIKMTFSFNIKRKTYALALSDGTKAVEDYINYLKLKGFKKEDVKTQNFNIRREKIYCEQQRNYKDGDFIFSFGCEIGFDYDLDLMSHIMEETAKIKECPTYRVDFSLKNEKESVDELMTLAFQHAKAQAEVIAKAGGKKLKDCAKVSFEPFDEQSTYNYGDMDRCLSKGSSSGESIQEIFVPKDIELDFHLYAIWLAE